MLKERSLLVFYNSEIARLIKREVIDNFIKEMLCNSEYAIIKYDLNNKNNNKSLF